MPMPKKQEAAKAAEQEPAKTEEKETVKAAEQEPAKTPERETAKARMVKVENPTKGYFVQPSTGLRIAAQEVKALRDDGWLELQLKAGTLKKA